MNKTFLVICLLISAADLNAMPNCLNSTAPVCTGKKPTINTRPIGALDSVELINGDIKVKGWALDPDVLDSVRITVQSQDRLLAYAVANQTYPGLSQQQPKHGDNHGFDITFADTNHTGTKICVNAVDYSGATIERLGCGEVSRNTLRVMAWNIYEGNYGGDPPSDGVAPLPSNGSIPLIAREIRMQAPDVVLLNEVRHYDLDFGGWQGDYVRQTKLLSELTGMPYYQYGKTSRMGWSGHKMVGIISRFPLSTAIRRPIMYAGNETGFSMLESTINFSGLPVHLFALRFSPVHYEDPRFDWRQELLENTAAHQQASEMLARRSPNEAIVFGGDMNAQLSESRSNVFVNESTMTSGDLELADGFVDYIYYHGPLRLKHFERTAPENPLASDHVWVFAEFVNAEDPQCPKLRDSLQKTRQNIAAQLQILSQLDKTARRTFFDNDRVRQQLEIAASEITSKIQALSCALS